MSREFPIVVVRLRVLESDRKGVGHLDLHLFAGLFFDHANSFLMLLFEVGQLFPLLSATSSLHPNCCKPFIGCIGLPEVSKPQAELVICTDDDVVEIELV